MVAPIKRAVGRNRINDPDEKVTARFAAGTLDRIKASLAPKEPQSEFLRLAARFLGPEVRTVDLVQTGSITIPKENR